MAKLTKNRTSLQVIIPTGLCDAMGWKAGDEVTLQQNGTQLIMEKKGGEPTISTEVYTIGYEGKSMADFIHELTIRKITQLIDVRQLAFSRKPGFSKTALKSNLEKAGISYRHIPELGSPSDVRHIYKEGGSLTTFMEEYRAYLDTKTEAYDELRAFVLSKPSAMMCFEKQHFLCHREILADRLFNDGFHITHI